MEISHKIVIFLLGLFICFSAKSQNEISFCKAVKSAHLKKIERKIKELIQHNNRGEIFYNGAGSGNQIDYTPCYDSIINWLIRQPCIVDAYWDKCQNKELSYPGKSAIGIKFNTEKGILEKCYLIQQGTTGQINILGYRPKLFKESNRLVYIKMFDCNGFIDAQKKNCKLTDKNL